jgi:hypothetical protein
MPPLRGNLESKSASADRLLATLPKNATEEIRVFLAAFRGQHLLSFRVFAKYKSGEIGPTRKGTTVRVPQAPALAGAISQALSEARSLGLLASE